jgi:hypothetical protein
MGENASLNFSPAHALGLSALLGLSLELDVGPSETHMQMLAPSPNDVKLIVDRLAATEAASLEILAK